jgi:glycosyltransferase involved in cell wall biosynthesis
MAFVHDHVEAAGHTIDWICAEDVPPRLRGPFSRFGFPWLVWRTARSAARRGTPYDIVNVHEPHGALVAIDQSRVSRYGVVVTSHGIEQRAWELALEEARLGRHGPGFKTRVVYPATSLWQSRLALQRARRVFVLSEEDRRWLAERWGVDGRRVARMRPGASSVYADAAEDRSYDRVRTLVFAATWRKNKGIEDFVPAFVTLARRNSGLRLTVLGAGVEPAVVCSGFPADVRQQVSVIPSNDDQTAARTLAGADVFVLPSLFEGTPLTLIEAMMSGLPIVTTDTCGMRDTIEHERTGLLIPLRAPEAIVDAVNRLTGDRQLRSRLGRCARQTAQARFTWPAVARDVTQTYERLVRDE